ncbi:hypothetical protein [Bacillus velezensis]|uniref:hypothetical protein n=1 Tax=Bacillus velezensis TaxID=492670 RepID=UPI00272F12FF|nr:hypothetical protein [Bacillus velezensis]MDP1503108.1 hypothetical protein [Bacillus velezensis]MDP1506967.1 hypothetical protein [Bacillus velezensis]
MRTKVDRAFSYLIGAWFAGIGVIAAFNGAWIGLAVGVLLAIIFGVVNYRSE